MRRRRLEMPAQPLLERARKRARLRGLEIAIERDDIIIPNTCPVLGIPLIIGGPRSDHSPSLDRIYPASGYVRGNVRVISDRANRLKSDRAASDLLILAATASPALKSDYRLVAAYIHREELLKRARVRAQRFERACPEWTSLVRLLDRIFAVGLVESGETAWRYAQP